MKNKKVRQTNPGQDKLPPSLGSLKEWFRRSNLSLTEKQYKQLWQYHNLLREKNEAYDLTRIFQFDNMVQKHYIDSILVSRLLELPSPLLDLGTGAGLPAIPLKIVCPETEFILSEGRHKRIQFLNEVVARLGLQKIEIYGHKTYASFSRPVKGVITRAVESIPETLRRVKKSLQPGGWAIFMKGPNCDEEIQEALKTMSRSYRLNQDTAYTIPHTQHQRRLVVFERLRSKEKMENEYSIQSRANETFKRLKTLLASRGIKKEGHALVFGRKIVNEVIRDFPCLCAGLILSPSTQERPEDLRMPIYRFSRELYRQLDIFGTSVDILLVKTPPLRPWQAEEIGCTLMIPFQNPENIGAVIRSAVAFGVKHIVMLQEAANPYHPKSIRAAGSAVFRVNYHQGPSINDLSDIIARQRTGLPLITLSMEGIDISQFRFPASFILLPGLEGLGLPKALRSHSLAIPMKPALDSLNAATAVAIALYEWSKGQR